MKRTLAWMLVLLLSAAPAAAFTPFASEVTDSLGPFGDEPYDDPQALLGKPALAGPPSAFGDGKFSMVFGAFGTGLDDEKLITTLNAGSQVTVKFDHKILDDPFNPHGVDFLVFGNAFFVLSGDTLNGSVSSEAVTVSVSPDGLEWYTYENGPFADDLFPTQPWQWDADGEELSDEEMDFTKPVNPALTAEDFNGLTLGEAIAAYDGSGGGTGFDLAESGFDWIQYVRVESDGGEVDAFSDVAPVFPPAAGQEGSTAVAKDDPSIVAWATGIDEVVYGDDVDEQWRVPENALGPAEGTSMDVLVLGRGGSVTLAFDEPIFNAFGPDFAVFENSFSDTFLELGYVEVSSNGVDFVRFDAFSLTPEPVGGFGNVDPTRIRGFAGKYRQGFGTPFDLEDLKGKPEVVDGTVDLSNIQYVKIVDVIGDGSETDAEGRPIYDPYPTSGSAGFDLDAVAVLSAPFTLATFEELPLETDSAWRGDETEGGLSYFSSGGAVFNNYFDTQWSSWSGFAYSNQTDTSATGLEGQFVAIPGGGKNSDTYAVSFVSNFYGPEGEPAVTLPGEQVVPGAYFTNNAYAYDSMRNGDQFAKQFTEDDWFKLTITGKDAAGAETGTVELLLADGTDILDEWAWQDLSGLGAVQTLEFSLSSSDVGDFGMNTPAYFCMDNLGATEPRTRSIELSAGWNQISLNVQPEAPIHLLLTAIEDAILQVWGLNADGSEYRVYDPENFDPENPDDGDLTELKAGRAYWFNMQSPATLEVIGSVPADKDIVLSTGMNFVGFYGTSPTEVETALASILDRLNTIWAYVDGYWQVYAPGFGASDLRELTPGQGYWVDVAADCTWSLED